MSALPALPLEVLINIFIHIDVPTNFVCSSKAFKKIGCDYINQARWIQHRYYRNEQIFEALHRIYDCPAQVLEVGSGPRTCGPSSFCLLPSATDA